MTPPKPLQLGDVARDAITGFEGAVVAITTYLNVIERQITIQPPELQAGKPTDQVSFYEGRLTRTRPAKRVGFATPESPHVE